MGFNELAQKLQASTSRETLNNNLKGLVEEGLVIKKPENPRKGQKVFYKLSESYAKLNKHLENLCEQRDLILMQISEMHYALDKGLGDSKLLDDFYKALIVQLSLVYFMANSLSVPFPKSFQELFFEKASKIVEEMTIRFHSLMERYAPNKPTLIEIDVFSFSNIFSEEDWLNWLGESKLDDYKRIRKTIEKHRS